MGTGNCETSVIIRTLNEEAKLGEVLGMLRRQTCQDFELLVVDSGSTDRTLEIAEEFGARIHRLPSESFTYGHALNYGCSRAQGKYMVALSGHTVPWFDGWLARLLSHFDADDVAASTGGGFLPGGDFASWRLRVVRIDVHNYLTEPTWGLNNAASAFRADLWRRHPFDEKLPYAEDLEWGWHWMKRGHAVVWDEGCSVIHEHDEPLRQQLQRARREHAALAAFLDVPRYRLRDCLTEWLVNPAKEAVLALLRGYAPSRAMSLWGKYHGLRHPSFADHALEQPAEVEATEEASS